MQDFIRLLSGPLGLAALLLGGIVAVIVVSRLLGGPHRQAVLRVVPIAARTLLVLGTAVSSVLLFRPVTRTQADRAIDLDVGAAIESAFHSPTMRWQLIGNLVLLTWLGFLLPFAFASIGPLLATVIALAASVAVEVLQYALGVGRVSAASDVVLNVTGAALAAVVAGMLRSRMNRQAPVLQPA